MDLNIKTHMSIHQGFVGKPLLLGDGESLVVLDTNKDMVADERGLVHGGFVFGLADYAAMIAVNDPNVVLASANVTFVAPVREGEQIIASAKVMESKGRKKNVFVSVKMNQQIIFRGEFVCVVLERHVLG